VPTCATCGGSDEPRLYEVPGEGRQWWCVDCAFFHRRLGVEATLAPAWVERAALGQLPWKPVDATRDRLVFSGRRLTDRRAVP
jgi:hypothetical protein